MLIQYKTYRIVHVLSYKMNTRGFSFFKIPNRWEMKGGRNKKLSLQVNCNRSKDKAKEWISRSSRACILLHLDKWKLLFFQCAEAKKLEWSLTPLFLAYFTSNQAVNSSSIDTIQVVCQFCCHQIFKWSGCSHHCPSIVYFQPRS